MESGGIEEITASRSADPWELAQDRLREILDEHSYRNWFLHTKFESCLDGCLVVGAPSQFIADWLRDHYMDAVNGSVRELIPGLREIRFVAAKGKESSAGGRTETPKNESPVQDKRPKKTMTPKPPRKRFEGFHPRYTFDRFVVGSSNRFAHAAAKAVAEEPSRAYNPLFFYSATGLGKTHLMQALGQESLERFDGLNVVFISSEQFTNQLIESIAKKSTAAFRAKYRKVDILLIDDIQFIAGKEATQEEFFHTFNALFDNHKQVVLSSDRPPKDIPGLEERLISRFEWGLVTDMQAPDFETRVAILRRKAVEENATVPREVLEYIASYVTNNIRELEGTLITVLALSKLTSQEINIPMVEVVLRDMIGHNKIKPVTIEGIQKAVADYFDVRISDLRGRSRQRQIAFPRQIAMFLCKTMVQNLSLTEIGEAFGGKDHTTVIYSCQKIDQESRKNQETNQILSELKHALRN